MSWYELSVQLYGEYECECGCTSSWKILHGFIKCGECGLEYTFFGATPHKFNQFRKSHIIKGR